LTFHSSAGGIEGRMRVDTILTLTLTLADILGRFIVYLCQLGKRVVARSIRIVVGVPIPVSVVISISVGSITQP
jgi:hypothetical protein